MRTRSDITRDAHAKTKADRPNEPRLRAEALAMRRQGMTYKAIAETQGRSIDVIRRRIWQAERDGWTRCPECSGLGVVPPE